MGGRGEEREKRGAPPLFVQVYAPVHNKYKSMSIRRCFNNMTEKQKARDSLTEKEDRDVVLCHCE